MAMKRRPGTQISNAHLKQNQFVLLFLIFFNDFIVYVCYETTYHEVFCLKKLWRF